MILTEWKCQCITFPTPAGVGSAVRNWRHVQRLYVTVVNQDGLMGIGECAPLPGYSPETADDCRQYFSEALPNLTGSEIQNVADIESLCARVPTQLPSARFALESALLDVLARSSSIPLWQLFAVVRTHLRVNGLLHSQGFQETAQKQYEQGIRVFKLKLNGTENIKTHVAMLRWLRDTYGDAIDIRIDANGTLRPEKLVETLSQIAPFSPEYVEEPVPFSQLPATALPVSIAFDESLRDGDAIPQMLAHPACGAVILKPSLLGGFFRVRQLAAAAMAASRNIVITHMFESLPGFLAVLHLAASLPPGRACGLLPPPTVTTGNSHPYFTLQKDVIQPGDNPGIGIAQAPMPGAEGIRPC